MQQKREITNKKREFNLKVAAAKRAVEEAEKQAVKDLSKAYSETEYFAADALESQMRRVRNGEQKPSDTLMPVCQAEFLLRQAKYNRAVGLAMCSMERQCQGRFIDPQLAGVCTYATLLSVRGLRLLDHDALEVYR